MWYFRLDYIFIYLFFKCNQYSKAWLISFELELVRNLFCTYNLIIISRYNLIRTVLKMDLSLKRVLWLQAYDLFLLTGAKSLLNDLIL